MVAGMVAMGGKLYVTGGNDGAASMCGEVLDLATMQWEWLPEMNTQRHHHGKCRAACHDGGGWAPLLM